MARRTRQEMYPDTDVFHFYNANPKGRITGDCEFRAISTGTGKSYNECVMEMAELMCETGFALNDWKGEMAYMKRLGWKKNPQPRKQDGSKYTGREFCKLHPHGTYIAHIGGHHIVAIIDGKIQDIWDSSDGCIGIYWTR